MKAIRHDGSKNSTPNSALISARPSVKWQLFSYKEENQSTKSKLNTLHHKITIEFESFKKDKKDMHLSSMTRDQGTEDPQS